MTTQPYTRTITYNRDDNDFTATVNDVFIGCYPTHRAAEDACDAYVFDQLRQQVEAELTSDTRYRPVVAAIVRRQWAVLLKPSCTLTEKGKQYPTQKEAKQ